jgi:sulfur carrier protein ThiS
VEGSILFLKVTEDIKDYAGLSRAAFKTKEIAYEALIRQLDYNEEGIAVVEKDDTILKVPKLAKNVILNILRKGFELTKTQLIDELDDIFN